MFIIVGLTLPLLLFTVAAWVSTRNDAGRRLVIDGLWCAAGAALWVILAAAILLTFGIRWPRATQIAWSGVSAATPTQHLQIGGSPYGETLGWPNGQFRPAMVVRKSLPSAEEATLEFSLGGAFILSESGQVLNGEALRVGQTIMISPYRLTLERAWFTLRGKRYKLKVVSSGKPVVTFDLKRRGGDSFLNLGNAYDAALRRSPSWWKRALFGADQLTRNVEFERWSRAVALAVTGDGIRVLPPDNQQRLSCKFPCTYTVRWTRISLPITVNRTDDDRAQVAFGRPWRSSSPLPPAGASSLVLTSSPRPLDTAFILPVGSGVRDARPVVMVRPVDGRIELVSAPGRQLLPDESGDGVIESAAAATLGPFRVHMVAARDLLRPARVIVLLLAGLLAFLVAIRQLAPYLDDENRWVSGGLLLTILTLLVFRVLLAVRYAADPAYIDRVGVKGIVVSIGALLLAPLSIALVVRIRLDHLAQRSRPRWPWIHLSGAFVIALMSDRWIFPSLPASLATNALRATMTAGLLLLGGTAVMWSISRGVRWLNRSAPAPLHEGYRPQDAGRVFGSIESDAEAFWAQVAGPGMWSGRTLPWILILSGVLILWTVGVPLLLRWAAAQFGEVKVFQDVGGPLVFVLLPVFLWLVGNRLITRQVVQPHRLTLIGASFVTLFMPAFITPFFLGDPGSILATTAALMGLAIILFADHNWLLGTFVTACVVSAALLALVATMSARTVYPVLTSMGAGGNVPARLFVYKEGFLGPDVLSNAESLLNAYEHTWENRAIAHASGLNGFGFGAAPVRRSRVAQDTLQYDSVFSFFVVGDYGHVGGLGLLLIYAVPLILLFRGRILTPGVMFVFVIAMAMFGEAVFHALMNLGLLPFAGRNLPILAVTSLSDVLKWVFFWAIALLALHWRRDESLPGTRGSGRLWVAVVVLTSFVTLVYSQVSNASDRQLDEPLTWSELMVTARKWIRDGLIEVDANDRIVMDKRLQNEKGSLLAREIEQFNASTLEEKTGDRGSGALLDRISSVKSVAQYQRVLRSEIDRVSGVPPTRPLLFRLTPRPKYADLGGVVPLLGGLFELTVNRDFNSSLSFRTATSADSFPTAWIRTADSGRYVIRGEGFDIRIAKRNRARFENRRIELDARSGQLELVRQTDDFSPGGSMTLRTRNGKLDFLSFEADPNGLTLKNAPTGLYLRVLRSGKDAALLPGRTFKAQKGDVLTLAREGAGFTLTLLVDDEPHLPIVGPAWVQGRHLTVADTRSAVPWVRSLVFPLEREWQKRGRVEAERRYAYLSLRDSLHSAAQRKAEEVGQPLHERAIQEGRKVLAKTPTARRDAARQFLPPRTAISVLSLPDGEVLALGSWPRASVPSGHDSWSPPERWLASEAPALFRSRYAGDRNFDRIEMGSATKPVLAAAALTVHPGVEKLLRVQGAAGEEQEVFGIRLEAPWTVGYSRAWTGFDDYLRLSDNRFHIRLGFLTLAEKEYGAIETSGRTETTTEAFGQAVPWRRIPRFIPGVEFSPSSRMSLNRVDDTAFASNVRRMFGVGIRQGEVETNRFSFWTRDERDDLPVDRMQPRDAELVSDAFAGIAPESANMMLERLSSPRRFVSFLLGGADNRWSNVEFAAAFATAITGRPTLAHVSACGAGMSPEVLPDRLRFPAAARLLRPGLARVTTDGTVAGALTADAALQRRWRSARWAPNVRIYAKTGTLSVDRSSTETSRLVMALVVWRDEAAGAVERGVVLSMVQERSTVGQSSRDLIEFVLENKKELDAILAGS